MDSENKTLNENMSKQGLPISNWSSNPLSSAKIAKINAITPSKMVSNRLYSGYNNYTQKPFATIDYSELISVINNSIKNKNNANELFYALHNIFTNKLNSNFTAFGYCNQQSKCVNLKLIDKIGSTYSTKIFNSDSSNPVIEAVMANITIDKESNKLITSA